MEESVKRRERLKAMRVEASQTGASDNVEASAGLNCLSNPLVETSTSLPGNDFSATPRFDYYTDPLSAFSGNKKRNVADTQDYPTPPSNVASSMMQFSPSHQGAWNSAMTPPAHQFPSNYAHNPRMYPAQPPPYNSGPQGMPVGNPFHMHQPNRFPSNPPYPNPGFGQMNRPGFSPGQGRGNWISPSPRPDSGRGGYASHGPRRGRGHQFAGHGPGRSGGRGQGNPAHGGRPSGPERLYHKSMIEDPWKFCQPVKWKSTSARAGCSRTYDSSQPWLPKSISSNTARVPEASKYRPGPSLAESLAAALYETVNENDKQGT